MTTRVAALALGAAVAAFGLGQTASAASPNFFKQATRNGAAHQGAAFANLATGFNTLNVSFCAQYNNSGAPTYLFVYGTNGSYIFTDNPYNQVLLAPACVTGYLVGVNVIDSQGDWDSVYVYNHS